MKLTHTLLLSAIATVCLLSLLKLGGMGEAHAGVQKCVGTDGAVTYTDGACGTIGTPVALPMDVARAVANEADTTIEYDASGSVTAPSRLGPRSPQAGCARSPDQLQADIGYAFASRDVNRIAGNYHWVGLNQRDARVILSKLESIADDRVIRSELFASDLVQAFTNTPLASGDLANAGFLQLALANGTPIQMQVTQYRGCYFARF